MAVNRCLRRQVGERKAIKRRRALEPRLVALQELRRQLDITQRELAAEAGRSQAWLSAIETGLKPFTPRAESMIEGAIRRIQRSRAAERMVDGAFAG
jgi:predicted transcriptional regulator